MGPSTGQSLALPLLLELRRFRRGRVEPQNTWCGCRDGVVTIRPIAGTRPRGATPEQDKILAEELLADAKERAEHLMLLDLGRNDVGRVAEVGSVRVFRFFLLEYYSQVMHIVCSKATRASDAIDALMSGISRRHRVRRAEGARHGDHR